METGEAQMDDDLKRLLEKLADNKPVVEENSKEDLRSQYCERAG